MPVEPQDAHVIVVEDNADNLFIVADLLQAEVGVKYYNGPACGRQLFTLLGSKPELRIDLILLDIQIPYEDGYQVLAQIRQQPALRGTKVVAVTANVMPQDIARARDAGFDGFIGKPIHAERFPQQIGRILADEAVWEPR
jgi:two-component system, cell cycle response regulator DivK